MTSGAHDRADAGRRQGVRRTVAAVAVGIGVVVTAAGPVAAGSVPPGPTGDSAAACVLAAGGGAGCVAAAVAVAVAGALPGHANGVATHPGDKHADGGTDVDHD